MNTTSTPERPPGIPRPLIIASVFLGAALILPLIIVLWPVLRAVSGVLVEHATIIAFGLLIFLGLLATGGLRIVYEHGRRLAGLADQAGLTRLEDGLPPLRASDVSELVGADVLRRAMKLHHRTTLADAQRQFPALTSYHQSLRYDGAPALPEAEMGLAVVEPPPGLEEAIRRGLSTKDRWYVGTDQAGQPQLLTLKYTGFIAQSGLQGTGKTNLAILLAGQCAAHGGTLFVGDPHLGDPESLSAQIEPFSGAVERFGRTADEINALIVKVDRIYQRRCAYPGEADRPILLIIDEFMDLVVRGVIAPAQLQALLALSGTGRKKRIFVDLISQNWSQRMVGALVVAIRQCVTHALVCRSPEETAKFLLPSSFAQQASMLRLGESLFYGPGGEPILTMTPEIKPAELGVAARGLPPRPYSPWTLAGSQTPAPRAPAPVQAQAQPSAPPIPPTVPLPIPPAAPTQRLNLNVPDQIVDLLRATGQWMTAAEIADALGADVKTVRTEMTSLWRKQLVQRQSTSRSPSERYEYSSQRIDKSPSQHLTPTA
jgi:hypothetical protein